MFHIAHTKCQSEELFQCQPSSDNSDLFYTPNIPELYFNLEYIINANLSALDQRTAYIFTIPSSFISNCSGTVTSLQYCYQKKTNNTVGIFNFLTLTSYESFSQFTVSERTNIRTVQTTSTCTSRNNNIEDCCDTTHLSGNHVLNSSHSSFGVEIEEGFNRPLAFHSNITEYSVDQYQCEMRNNNIYRPGNVTNGPLLLIRLFIGNIKFTM